MKVLEAGLAGLENHEVFDVVVVGAGGAGLSAALFAALQGAKVLVVERTDRIGGTTALSAGTTWVPGTQHAAQVNPADTLEQARIYLDAAVGERSDPDLRQAFLAHGRAAVDTLAQHSAVQYRPYPKHPDYISDLPGSTLNGRALEPLPFDGRLLGDLFRLLREPIPEFTVLGVQAGLPNFVAPCQGPLDLPTGLPPGHGQCLGGAAAVFAVPASPSHLGLEHPPDPGVVVSEPARRPRDSHRHAGKRGGPAAD